MKRKFALFLLWIFGWKLKGEFPKDIKKSIIEHSPLVKSLYQNAENPIFEAFYLEDAKATIADFSGNPPVTYVL